MRLRALDWLRGIAVLVMVECHVFNALLASEYRTSGWFNILNYLNGFVAPAFLLVSGAVMGLNLQNRWDKGTGKMWRRVGQIFIVAYLLHLPTPFLWQFFGPRGPHLVELWTKMDILQCVAGSLAIILLLVPVCRTPKIHRAVCLVLGVAVAMLRVDAGNVVIPKWLLNYVWPTGVGVFPLVPWAAFPLAGVWFGPAIFASKSRGEQTIRCVLAAAVMLVTTRLMPAGQTYDAAFVYDRLSWLFLALGACVWLGAPVRGTGWILQFGELSLWSYTVHLGIVYGSCMNLGLDSLGARFSPVTVLGALAGVLIVTGLVVNWRAKNLQRRAALRMMPRP
jgi:uncharacterized membrane protein